MTTLKELCAYTDELLQNGALPDYCNNGLQVEGKEKITRIATAVTASLATIHAAIKCGAHALIVHHGLFWTGDSYVIAGSKRDKLNLLLKHEISLIAYHLPLDAHQELGNNWKAARDMGWTELQPFGITKNKNILLGVRGRVPSISRDKFRWRLEEYYQHPAHCALGGPSKIKTAALISGGAHRSISEAISAGVDCFITGSFDEPVWHQAYEEGINFFALGHSATERIGPQALGEHLKERFGVEHHFLDIPNPF